MAEPVSKRKTTRPLQASNKRMRVETESTTHDSTILKDDENEDVSSAYEDDGASNDDDSRSVNTPITPFSPSRNKFPSELKTIKCTYEGCTKTFNRPIRLVSHLRSHTNERPFKCQYPDCDKAYMEEKHLQQHIKGSHTHERNHKCDWEGCEKSFLTATRLRRHRDAHQGHDRFRCTAYPPCNQTFRKHQTLQRHIRADHLELTPFPCSYVDPITQIACNAGFDSGGALRKHEDRLHGLPRYWCDECMSDVNSNGSGFATEIDLAKHLRTAYANCMFCDFRFSGQQELQKHIDIYHSKISHPVSERKAISCTYPACTKTFTKKYNLGVHVRTAHEGERFICGQADISNSSGIPFWDGTDACGKDFVSKVNLVDHVRTQHLGLPSTVNAKRVKQTNVARSKKSRKDVGDPIKHLTGIAYADGKRNISCLIPDCEWKFTREYDLQQHLKSKHGEDSKTQEFSTEEGLAGLEFNSSSGNDRTRLDEMYDQADLDWEMQRRDVEGAPFWVGVEEDSPAPIGEMWSQEQAEMRKLIDWEIAPAEEYPSYVDPALRYM